MHASVKTCTTASIMFSYRPKWVQQELAFGHSDLLLEGVGW